jgi:hypothetical protein
VIVLVARQQGKTTLASVLAAWWLFVDSARHPDRVPPLKFKVVGVAQNLDIAREPWAMVKLWCDPKPETDEEAELAIAALQAATAKVIDTNGKERSSPAPGRTTRSAPRRTLAGSPPLEGPDGRDARAARLDRVERGLADHEGVLERHARRLLERRRLRARWCCAAAQRGARDLVDAGSSSPTTSTAGISSSRRLRERRGGEDVVARALRVVGPSGCAKDDVDGILQANPSIGYGSMTVEICLADIRGMTDAGYRTEVLCQWVTSKVDSFIDVKDWNGSRRPMRRSVSGSRSAPARCGASTRPRPQARRGSPPPSSPRSSTRREATPFVTVRVKRAGMLWVPDYLADSSPKSRALRGGLQGRGCPAMEFIEPLRSSA